MWVVYYHPVDYPEQWVARERIVRDGKEQVTENMIVAPNLAAIRKRMIEMHLTYVPRKQSDDPKIVGCWI
jgi:hypothetical protein